MLLVGPLCQLRLLTGTPIKRGGGLGCIRATACSNLQASIIGDAHVTGVGPRRTMVTAGRPFRICLSRAWS